mgnify:CR=1 FL=1
MRTIRPTLAAWHAATTRRVPFGRYGLSVHSCFKGFTPSLSPQWLVPNHQGGGCWAGNSDKCGTPSKGNPWVGQGRTAPQPPGPPPPPPPPSPTDRPQEAQPSYDDHTWALVDAPHDFVVGNTANEVACPSGCSGRSYLPRDSGWYRKHFVLPTDWKGTHISVLFEGIFRYAMIYFNGELLATHDCGYTSFAVRLDNASTVNFGTTNVLAIWVDAMSG